MAGFCKEYLYYTISSNIKLWIFNCVLKILLILFLLKIINIMEDLTVGHGDLKKVKEGLNSGRT